MMKFILAIFICSSYLSYVISENKTDTTSTTFLLCETAKRTYKNAGYKEDDIYTIEQDEASLKVCGQTKTCCKASAEKNLVNSSEKKRKDLTNPLHQKLQETFQLSGSKFRAFFQSMMSTSQRNLNSMFNKTYSTHYTKNAYIFKELYTFLQQYINGSELDLKVKFNMFFSNLHEKVYIMSNSWLSFDEKYRNCIRDKTHSIKPFGEKQMRISYQTTRAFEASRVFLEGLKEGMEVTLKLLDIPVHDQCEIAFMKMTQCSICSGVNQNMKPCSKYCINVMKGCYAYIIMIQGRWNNFVTSMINLAAKLEGPFNLEALVVPLGVKISEAIMTFQENQRNITARVQASCGRAPTKTKNERKRRNTEKKNILNTLKVQSETLITPGENFQSKTQQIINNLKSEKNNQLPYPTFMKTNKGRAPSEFEKLLSTTKKALNELKDYWIILPSKLCEMGMASDKNTNCWNGVNTTGYTKDVVDSGVVNLFMNNPEMKLNQDPGDSIIMLQDGKLKFITAKINSVIEGNGVNCVDCETSDGSGAGEDDDDSDNEGSGHKNTGSGGKETKEKESSSGTGVETGSGRSTEAPNSIITNNPTTKCHENDPNCFYQGRNQGTQHANALPQNPPLPWTETVKDPSGSSGTVLATNLLLLLLSAVLAMLCNNKL